MKASNVQTLFDLAASRHRLDTAIVYKNRRVSYEALKGRSDRLASLLVASGARKGTVVAILCEDAVEVVSSIIAALKAGCVFVPLDLAMPDRRLRAMLDEVSPGWLITESHLLGRVTGVAAEGPAPRVICTDLEHPHSISGEGIQEIFGLSASLDAEGPRVESGPDDMCYIYFTSGSTGKPKGIAGRLKSIDHFIRWEIETFSLDETVRVSHLAPASFDASLRDIFVPLCLGGTLHIPPDRETILDGGRLASWIDREQITLLHCVPSVFRSLTNEPLRPEQFASLKQILMAGEPLLPSDVGRWYDVFGDRVQLANLYGPSETTIARGDEGHSWSAAIVFAAAAITDQVDGWLARRLRVESQFGKYADPLADRLMIDVAVIMLFLEDRLPWAALVIIVGRDLLLVLGTRLVVPRGYEFSVSFLGKLATWVLYAGIGLVIATPAGTDWPLVIFWVGAGLAVAAAVSYALAVWKTVRGR